MFSLGKWTREVNLDGSWVLSWNNNGNMRQEMVRTSM